MSLEQLSGSPELWAGIECTINRVGDRYHDQLQCNGHRERVKDLDLFAQLGIRALRYPVLWEQFAPDNDLDHIDWSWADVRLERLRDLGIRPIVGLVHHGSGPRETSLVDHAFADGLGNFAHRVAERFPWVSEWTPVNEPLTTARFSGLYGHWYPHGRDEQTFARALINECRATALSMQAIRAVIPTARLVQTEDMGKIYSTEHMRYQADFENERRWLTWDLLCGRVDRYHRMWGHLLWSGIGEEELQWFLEHPCPPDILGINHYLTSERYLDERLTLYPSTCYGSNDRDRYADVEAVRVLREGTDGIRGIMHETWQRYHIPLAITEVHLGCTREEQMRWLLEVWVAANAVRGEGVDVLGVTAWALLGSYDWNSLLTRFAGHYEPGVFDMRSGRPRATAIASMLKSLAEGRQPLHPVLASAGWWRHPRRIFYAGDLHAPDETLPTVTVSESARSERACNREDGGAGQVRSELSPQYAPARPILITGAGGKLGYAFARLCDHRNLACVALTRSELDIADLEGIDAVLDRYHPWAVINAAGFTRIDEAQQNPHQCYRDNAIGPVSLATACARHHISLLTLSSHMVFDGKQRSPYTESAEPSPLNVYACSKVEAEEKVLEILPEALVVRTGAFFGPWDLQNFLTRALSRLALGHPVTATVDAILSPTYVPDLVHACLDLLIDGEGGIWHLANEGAVSWHQFTQMAAERTCLDPARIEGARSTSILASTNSAPRPQYTVLASERGQILQPLDDALDCYLRDSSELLGRFSSDRTIRPGLLLSGSPLHTRRYRCRSWDPVL